MALKLAWTRRVLSPGNPKLKTIPDCYLKEAGALNFLPITENNKPQNVFIYMKYFRIT